MAILTGPEIERRVKAGDITIEPFDPMFVNPASYDLRLGDQIAIYRKTFKVYDRREECYQTQHPAPGDNIYPRDEEYYLDAADEPDVVRYNLDERGFVFKPGIMYLGCTVETCSARNLVPVLDGKSSIGRLGVSIHQTAGFGDPGFKGQWTLEITAISPVRLYPGMQVGQVRFETIEGQVRLYNGNYKGALARGPIASRAHAQLAKLRGVERRLLLRQQLSGVLEYEESKSAHLTFDERLFIVAIRPKIEAGEEITDREAERLATLYSLSRA